MELVCAHCQSSCQMKNECWENKNECAKLIQTRTFLWSIKPQQQVKYLKTKIPKPKKSKVVENLGKSPSDLLRFSIGALVNHQVAVGTQPARGAYWIETWPHPKSFRDLTLWELYMGIVPRCCWEFWARILTTSGEPGHYVPQPPKRIKWRNGRRGERLNFRSKS